MMTANNNFTNFAENIWKKKQDSFCNYNLRREAIEFLNHVKELLFPHFSSKIYSSPKDILAEMQLLKRDLILLLEKIRDENSVEEADIFLSKIPEIYGKLWSDAEAINSGDPATESIDEVILAYPGFMAIFIYRIAHELYKLNIPLIPRILTEYGHQVTGVDIHPGAEIDSPFFIDHGTGIVIGETTIIGKNVKIYQGVTLGALSVEKALRNIKRHPTIKDNVIIYAQAVILGGDTVIGENSIVGGNTWITQSIPADSVVYSRSEVKVRSNSSNSGYFDTLDYII